MQAQGLLKKVENLELAFYEAVEEVADELIKQNCNKTVRELREVTSDFIRENQMPPKISNALRRKIDTYIENLVFLKS